MIRINDVPVEVNYFPDGTHSLNLDIPLSYPSKSITIEWLYEPNEEMVLYYIVKHIRSQEDPLKQMVLYIPYIPNARMDRVKGSEVFTLKYFCEFINDLNFKYVVVRDAHSNVSLALLDRVICENIAGNIKNLVCELLDERKDIVFYPDEGACKRYSDMIKFPHAFGIKKRNREIVSLDVFGNLPKESFDVLIVDDISSYGGTFFHSAKKLKELGANKIYLYISHCENSILDGELIKSGLIERIYTTKSIFTGQHDLIEVIGG